MKTAEHLRKIYPKMFPDWEIAKNLHFRHVLYFLISIVLKPLFFAFSTYAQKQVNIVLRVKLGWMWPSGPWKKKKHEIMWAKCKSLGLDNNNTNFSKHISIKSRALKENKPVFIAGCNCHLVHISAGQGGKAFTNISGFYMEEHRIDIYHYFNRGARWKGILKEYFEHACEEWDNIIWFVSTRWLSLELCCKKESTKWRIELHIFQSAEWQQLRRY